MRCSNRRMASKRDFGKRCEDIDIHFFEVRASGRKMQENNLGEVEFCANLQFLLLREIGFLGCWDADDGYGISIVAGRCERVECGERELHFEELRDAIDESKM